jgi:hypothetical protein
MKHGRMICPVICLVVATGLTGCATSGDDPLGMRSCRVVDGDGRTYSGEDFTDLNALERGLSECKLGARDPTSCRTVACGTIPD